MKLKVLFFSVFALACIQLLSPAFAVDMTADQLYKDCQKNDDANKNMQISLEGQFQAGMCVGYIKGLDDMLYLYYSKRKDKSSKVLLYCLPDGGTLNDMGAAYINYMKNHPEQNHEEAGKVLIKALMEKYPC